jgi:hypothetical protein
MPSKFGKLVDELAFSDSEVARLADVDLKTVKKARKGETARKNKLRPKSKRALLEAVNPLLQEKGKAEVGPEVFIDDAA